MMKTIGGLVSLIFASAATAADAPKSPDRTAMYEDVEVFRRLLADKLAYARNVQMGRTVLWQGDLHHSLNTFDANIPYISHYYRQVGLHDTANYYQKIAVNSLYADVTPLTGVKGAITVGLGPQPVSLIYDFGQTNPSPPAVDGTYIKGVGVVYSLAMARAEAASLATPRKTASLASNCAKCHGTAMAGKIEPPPSVAKKEPIDSWDATLNSLRGVEEKPVPAPAVQLAPEDVCIPGNLTELLLNSLTSYGHRFRELGPTESWTVVVTLTPDPSPPAVAVPGIEALAKRKKDADEAAALGDLHAKQAKHDDAVKTYQKAIDLLAQPFTFPEETPYDQAKVQIDESSKALRSVYGKLAQTLLTTGKLDEAKAAIEKAKSAAVRVEAMPKPVVAPVKAPLPIKLTVTLSKKAVDEHKAGKMNLFELRSAAEVEVVGFSSPAKKPTK